MFSKDACQTLNSSCNDEKKKPLLLGVVKAVLWGTGAAVGLCRGCVLQPRLRGRRRAAPPPPAPRRRPLNTCYLFKRPLVSSCFAEPRTPFGEVEPKLGCGRLTGGCLWRRRDKWKVRAGRKGCGRNRNSARIVSFQQMPWSEEHCEHGRELIKRFWPCPESVEAQGVWRERVPNTPTPLLSVKSYFYGTLKRRKNSHCDETDRKILMDGQFGHAFK